MKKINIIQFLPYFPPHKGGLETVAEEFSKYYVAGDYGNIINITFDIGQEIEKVSENDLIKYKGEVIGYNKDGYKVYLLPSFDIIPNFPFPKFWSKTFWRVLKEIKPLLTSPYQGRKVVVQTHTRFFLSSFLGGLFAKRNKLKWVHIEHGSDYVKLGSKLKSFISYMYDKTIGVWIFKKCDSIVAISNACKDFIQKKFVKRDVGVIYNGINFKPGNKKENINYIKIGFVGRLVTLKGVDLLIKSFLNLEKKYQNIKLEILGDGEEREFLEKLSNNHKNIEFLGFRDREFIAKEFLPSIDILVNPSFMEGLPTTVLEGLLLKCVIVATDVGGTKEISNLDDLILVKSLDILDLEKGIEKALLNYKKLSGISYNHIKNNFDWNENIKKYFSLYNEV
ncbi:glycosyltransferase family 4 protein [Candidatus Gracilibacteria bacterium]|nr:glycosyltransferase family 4 protein [Candidatus Gracilibacteria bacterium]